MHRAIRLFLLPFFLAWLVPAAGAQTPAPSVGLGFAVDTTEVDVGPIVRLVRAYLAAPDSTALRRGLWRRPDPADHTHDDLAARYALQGFPASMVGVVPKDNGDSVYVVKLLHARAKKADGPVSLLALERLYAVRTPGSPFGWQLESALPRLTEAWPTLTAGRIRFHYAPGQRPDTTRARRADHFVDSVATLFDARRPRRVDYYVTASPDEYFRALGLDFFLLGSGRGEPTGGNALPNEGILFAGDAAQGELYRHELVHVALGRRMHSGFINEGAAAWLGGSLGQSPRQLYRALRDFQRAHPDVTFATIVGDKLAVPAEPRASSDAWYASGALACEAVYRRRGIAGLRALADAPSDSAVQHLLAKLLGLPDERSLEHWWRTIASEMSALSAPL